MIDVHCYRSNSYSTLVNIHQGTGSLDETLVMSAEVSNAMADALLDDLINGAVTVHAVEVGG